VTNRDKIYDPRSGIFAYMPPVSMPPAEEARSIFSRLGYTVSGDGPEFVAERKWRTVRVTALDPGSVDLRRRAMADGGSRPNDARSGYGLRCFVTWKDATGELTQRLKRANPSFEWAVIGVDDGGEYTVFHPEAH
jgi:hypothetical protein